MWKMTEALNKYRYQIKHSLNKQWENNFYNTNRRVTSKIKRVDTDCCNIKVECVAWMLFYSFKSHRLCEP